MTLQPIRVLGTALFAALVTLGSAAQAAGSQAEHPDHLG